MNLIDDFFSRINFYYHSGQNFFRCTAKLFAEYVFHVLSCSDLIIFLLMGLKYPETKINALLIKQKKQPTKVKAARLNYLAIKAFSKTLCNRPVVVLGLNSDGVLPTKEYLGFTVYATVYSLTSKTGLSLKYDRVYIDPQKNTIIYALERKNISSKIDVFWDRQACSMDLPYLKGLNRLSAKKVAGICHHNRPLEVYKICEQYDVLFPLFEFVEFFEKRYPQKSVEVIPFGGNWGDFNNLVKGRMYKPIDVLVSFDRDSDPWLNRDRVLDAMECFAKNEDRLKVVFCCNIPRKKYFTLLRKSKVCINVPNFNGPENYRINEAAAAEAMLVHVNCEFGRRQEALEYLYEETDHVIRTDISGLSSTLKAILLSPNRTCRQKSARKIIEKRYGPVSMAGNIIGSLPDSDVLSRDKKSFSRPSSEQEGAREDFQWLTKEKKKQLINLVAHEEVFSESFLTDRLSGPLNRVAEFTNESNNAIVYWNYFVIHHYVHPNPNKPLIDLVSSSLAKSSYNLDDVGRMIFPYDLARLDCSTTKALVVELQKRGNYYCFVNDDFVRLFNWFLSSIIRVQAKRSEFKGS